MDVPLPNTGKRQVFRPASSVGDPSRLDLPDTLGSLCSRPSTTSGPSRFLSPIEIGPDEHSEDGTHPSVLAGREQNLRCGLVVADLNKRGVAECFEEYGLRDYFDQYGQRRFCNLSMSVAARRNPQVSKAFGSTSQHVGAVRTQNLFSAVAYRKASAMIEQDRQMHREKKDVQFKGLSNGERYRQADVRRRQLQLILHGCPGSDQEGFVPFIPAGLTEEVLKPVEPASRQEERDDRKRCERHNVYLAERNPQSVFLVKRQGWIFGYDDVVSIWEKLDEWMGAIGLTPLWGLDRSTFSQLLVDLSLHDKDHLPHVWAHQVFDAYAKPKRLVAGDPDYDEPADGLARAAFCVSRWDSVAVLDRLLRRRFDLSPREEFLSRLRAAYSHLQKDWKSREAEGKLAAQASQQKWQAWKSLLGVVETTVAQRTANKVRRTNSQTGSPKGRQARLKGPSRAAKEEDRIRESNRWRVDRHVSGMLKEPEVIQAVEQFRKVFTTMFECYASLRDNQHMAESDLVSFCSDFCLVPDLVPRHEIHRVYMMAECLFKHPVAASLSSSLTSDLSNVSTLSVPSRGSRDGGHSGHGKKPKSKVKLAEVVKTKKQLFHGMTKCEFTQADRFEGKDFGVAAFVESLCRLIFAHLLTYGNSLQQTMSSQARFVWLIGYLVQVLRMSRTAPQKGKTNSWSMILERLKDEDFTQAARPCTQTTPMEVDEEPQTESHGAVDHNSDTEDEGSPLEREHQEAPKVPFAKDAPDTSNWLFANLLVSPIDIIAHKKRGSRSDKGRKSLKG